MCTIYLDSLWYRFCIILYTVYGICFVLFVCFILLCHIHFLINLTEMARKYNSIISVVGDDSTESLTFPIADGVDVNTDIEGVCVLSLCLFIYIMLILRII